MIWAVAIAVAAPPCPERRAELAGVVEAGGLVEASGLVASGRDPEVLWSHNDSGHDAALFAIATDGTFLGRWPVDATAVDWEDVARHGPHLVVGDIGDNRAVRDHVTLWTVPEPDPRGPPAPLRATARAVRYEDGPRDAEVLLVHPDTAETVLVSKGREGDHGLYLVDGDVARRVGELPYLPATPFRTSGDVAHDGRGILLRGYTFAWWYALDPSETLVDALQRPPCPFPLAPEAKGESVAWGPDGAVYTLSEGERQPLWRYPASGAPR